MKRRSSFFMLVTGIVLPTFAYADCAGFAYCSDSHWKFIVGGQLTHRSPEIHYVDKDSSTNRVIDIEEDYTEKKYLPFPFIKLEYRINPKSSFDMTFNRDVTETSALQRRTIKFLFFPLKLGVRAPLKIDTQSLKLRYNHTIFQRENWEVGGSVGLQVLKVDAEAEIPAKGIETDTFTAPLPNVGIYASYSQSQKLSYRVRADYLPIKLHSTNGVLSELDLSLEYRYTPAWMLGAGYRYSYLDLELDQQSYHADISHITYGPTIFVGANF